MKNLPMIRKLGLVMGGLFLFGGIFGFFPGVNRSGLYLGIFLVNTPHALLHVASGAIFVIASMTGASPTRWWFLIFGTIYASMAVRGLQVGEALICGISNNRNDAWGHAGLAFAMLIIGFAVRPRTATAVAAAAA
jgi:hypothetical protein